MSQGDDLVQKAIAAYKAGQKDHSRNLLLQAIEVNEHHEQAWLWLSAVVDDLDEQQICLENVLALNPANERARKGLEAVNRKIAERQARASQEDELSLPDDELTFAPPRDQSARQPIGAEFVDLPDSSSFDWTQQAGPDEAAGQPAEPAFDDWLAAAAQEDESPFAGDSSTATSVDWARSDGPSVYGSGRQVELPSSQEFDDWVQGLNLDDGPNAAHSTQNSEPPGSSSRDEDEPDIFESAESSPPGSGASPFTEDAPMPAFDSSLSYDEDDWFSPEERARFGNVFTFDDEENESGEGESFDFNFDDDQPAAIRGESASDDAAAVDDDDGDDDWLSERLGSSIGVAPAFATSDAPAPAAVDSQDYFAYIPAGIEARSGIGSRSLLLLAAIVVLLVLNALSFGLLIF